MVYGVIAALDFRRTDEQQFMAPRWRTFFMNWLARKAKERGIRLKELLILCRKRILHVFRDRKTHLLLLFGLPSRAYRAVSFWWVCLGPNEIN